MPKAKLEFNLPEETDEFNQAQKGSSYKYFIDEFDNTVFRQAVKYGNLLGNPATDAEVELLTKLREEYWNLFRSMTED